MNKELKVRLTNSQVIISRLQSIGATHLRDITYNYTYFNQPEGKVLKLTTKGNETYKTIIEVEADRFIIKSSNKISKPKEVANRFASQHGIKKHLVNHRIIYAYEDQKISINDIEGVGRFLIVEGKDPQLSFVINVLGVENPEVITNSFDNL